MLSFFPYARINQVPIKEVYDTVRYVKYRWGFINTFRVDNGSPFGDPSRQAISALNLCLLGFGVYLKLNPPRSPRKNAKVERNQGTTSRWAMPSTCENYLEFQIKLNQAVLDQRENYKTRVCEGKTRAEKYPAIFTNPNRFHTEDFQIKRVYKFLSKGSWQRKVSAQGVVTLFTEEIQVGYKHRGTIVTAYFDPFKIEWCFKNEKGETIKSVATSNFTESKILTFS
jgi:hypothetical protein